MTTDDIDPVEPSTALKMYLQSRQSELADSSLASHRRRLQLFVEWCDVETDIETLDELSGRDLHEFSVWRQTGKKKSDISPETLRSALLTLRVFLRFCASIDAVEPALPERLVLPDETSRSRDDMLDADHAKELLGYLAEFEYASYAHTMLRVFWETGIRAGTLRSLDLKDFDPDKQALSINHRPDTGTPLKNGTAAERMIGLKEITCQVVTAYIEQHRPSTTDSYGRKPLFATNQGRRSQQSVRANAYYWTCPCRVDGNCPHGRDPETCDSNSWRGAGSCPSSVSTHPIRRGAITHHLRQDVPVQVASSRMDVSPEVLEKHYSQLSEEESMERRRNFLDNI